MVKLTGLLDNASDALGIAKPTVSVAFRALREAGLMTSGGRGRGAPDMSHLDLARLLQTFLVTESPAVAVGAVQDFGGMVCSDAHLSGDDRLRPFSFEAKGLDDIHSFEEAVCEIIRTYSEDRDEDYFREGCHENERLGTILPRCDITVNVSALSATINFNGNVYHYIDRDLFACGRMAEEIEDPSDVDDIGEMLVRSEACRDRWQNRFALYRANIRVERSVNTAVIDPLVSCFRTDR